MIAWALLKLGFGLVQNVWLKRIDALFGLIAKIAGFIIDRWRVFIPLAIVGLMLWYVYAVRAERDKVQQKFNEHLSQDIAAAKQRALEIEQSRQLGAKQTASLKAQHDADLQAIIASSKRKEIQYAKNQTLTAGINNSLRDGLRLAIEREAILGLLKDEQGGIASRDGDAALLRRTQEALTNCQEAGAICASDYNFCKGYVENEQERLGVE